MVEIQRIGLLRNFSCLGDRCEDTCCKGWSMQLDKPTYEKYQHEAPELLDAVEPDVDGGLIMRKDKTTTYCVKFEDGMCGVHKQYGDTFLGNACHFYPRVTRHVGDVTVMTASLSCPEIVRLALNSKTAFEWESHTVDRVPHGTKNVLPSTMNAPDVMAIHQHFLRAVDEAPTAEIALARISSVARSMALMSQESWPNIVPLYLRLADSRLPPVESLPEDPFNVLHALCGLIVASQKPMSERMSAVLGDMQTALSVTLDWQNAQIETGADSLSKWHKIKDEWALEANSYHEVLKRYLQMQLSIGFFPFAGLGRDLIERITIIAIRFATIKLAIMCSRGMYPESPPQDVAVRVIQTLSRLLDHLGDPVFSMRIYEEAGWNRESRMIGIINL